MPDSDIEQLNQLLLEGKCCASIMVQMGLSLRGERNEQMVSAVATLCNGVYNGMLCGSLSGAACMLGLFGDNPAESAEMTRELAEWFADTYGEKYGGTDCSDITGNDPAVKNERCRAIIEATYLQAKAILEDYGKILS
ncbi:C-GCAxxG-C-C family protein [Synergistaceae bacterium OttesenSCG-928-I11]|nr:C-GCAxxG-C-C family protein [Synergistaceae bacterium OttesenSCG-928-I11]